MNQFSRAMDQYRTQGYCSPLRVLDKDEAQKYRDALEDCERARGRPLTREEKSKPHLLFRWASELVRHPVVLDAVETIAGPDILVWDSTLFTKEAGGKEHLTWHQDLRYWGLEPGDQVVTAWIALSPSTRKSGCMRVVPSDRRPDLLPHKDTYTENNLLSRGQVVDAEVKDEDVIDIVLAPGEMSLHDVYIIHGSEPNLSDDRRLGFGVRYFPTSVRQRAKMRDSALLVRGVDRFGHFDLERQPDEFESSEAYGVHDELRKRRRELQASL